MLKESQLRGERRWTAVLCADLVDFTGVSAQLGPERTYELLREVVGSARAEIEAAGGHIIEYAGDALFAVFGAPTASENASLDACRAALSVQKRMDREAPNYLKNFNVKPTFRIGVAGGSVVFGSLGHGEGLDINVLGDAVNMAMRLQKETPNGTVIASDEIHDQVEGFVEAAGNGKTMLKGFERPIETFLISGLNESQTPFESRMQRGAAEFFGRELEFERLHQWLDAETHPTIEITGPAGAGKSRLLHEFAKSVAPAKRLLIGQCNLNTQKTPLTPIIEVIRKAINWNEADDKVEIARKLETLVGAPEATTNYIINRVGGFEVGRKDGQQPGYDPISIRRTCVTALQAIAADETVILVFEDCHWIDPSSETIILSLIDPGQARPSCRVVTTRRSHVPRGWTGQDHVTELALRSLSDDNIQELVQVLLGCQTADIALVDLVREKSERIPLFVEEIIRYLQFSQAITVEDGHARLTGDISGQIVGGNLQHLTLSRFDALPDDARALLRVAAVKGRQFSEEFLGRCSDPSQARATIDVAAAEGLIEVDPGRPAGNWRFSHALIGDAIYQSLLGPERRNVHATVANAMEVEADGLHAAAIDELAFHFRKAGNGPKAVEYLRRSAQRAYQIFAVVQVDEQLEAAFELIKDEPDLVDDETFGRMLFLWGRNLDIYGEFRKLNTIMETHIPRLQAQGATEALSLCLSAKALARCHAAYFDRAQELLNEALGIAADVKSEFATTWAKVIQMRINVDSGFGSLDDTAALYDEVLPVAERLGDSHLIQLSSYVMISAHRGVGSLRKANEYVMWLEDFGKKNNSTRAIAMTAWARCINHLVRDEVDAGIAAADENLRLSIPGTADWRVAVVGRLVARLSRGDTDVSPDDLLPHVDHLYARDDTTLGNVARVQYSIHRLMRGQIHDGWHGLVETSNLVERRGTPELGRFIELVKAEILMSIGGVLPREGPRPKLGAKDVVMALRLKLTARRRARAHLENFKRRTPFSTGYFLARVERDLGLLEKSYGNLEAAQAHFDRSVELYRNEDLLEAALSVEALRAT